MPRTLCLLLLSLLSACHIDIEGKPIRGREDAATIPAFRLQTEFGPRRGEETGLRLGMEADLERIRGDFRLQVGAGELLRVQNTAAAGQVETEFDATRMALAFRLARRTPQGLEMGLRVGPTFLDMDMSLRNGLLFETQSRRRAGMMVGFDMHYRIQDLFGPYLRGHAEFLSHSAHSRSLETGLMLHATAEVTGFVGLRYWEYEEDEMWDHLNDVDLEARGLVMGLQLRF